MARKIAGAALILLLSASLVYGEARMPAKPDGGQGKKDVHRLGEVNITGKAEHPGVMFILPRAKFRLLPLRERDGGKERLLRHGRGAEEFP